MPYVPYQGNGMTIAQLMRAAGENRAQGLRRSGEIQQQSAANLGNVVSQGAMTIGQMIRDEPIRQAQLAHSAQQPEIDALALRQAEQNLRVGEGRIAAQEQAAADVAETQRGRSVERGLMPLAMTEGPDGVPTYDRALLTKEFTTAGLADRLPEVFKSLDETEKAAIGLKAARQEFAQKGIVSLLRGVEAAGDTPSALQNAAQLGVAQGFFTKEEAGQYLARATDPASVRAIRMALSGQEDKPVEVSPNASLMSPRTGAVVGTAPGPTPTKANPTEASLAMAAAAGDKEAASALAILRRQNAPQGGGSEAQDWVVRGGVLTPIPRGTARVGDTPASRADAGRNVTSGDSGDLADFDTSLDDVAVLRTTIAGTNATGTSAAIGASMPQFATDLFGWGTESKQKQAVIDRVKQVIGKVLEGGVLRKEDEIKYAKILPTISDTADVAKTKLDGLEDAIKKRKQRRLDSLADAGYDISKFSQRDSPVQSPVQMGFKVTAPNGKSYSFETQAKADAFKAKAGIR